MGNAYLQVARTYVRPGLLVVPVAFIFVAAAATDGGNFGALIFLPLLACLNMSNHVQAQFANPRARMLPGFARVHLTVAGMVTISFCAAGCVLFAAVSGMHWAGPAILFTALAGVVASSAANFRFLFAWMVPAYAVVLSRGVNEWLQAFLREPPPGPSLFILAASVAAILWSGRRLAMLSEEDAAYWQLRSADSGNAGRRLPAGRTTFWHRWRDARLDRLLRRPGRNAWKSIRLSSLAVGGPSYALVAGFLLLYLIFAFAEPGGVLLLVLAIPVLAKARWNVMRQELIRALSRVQAIRRTSATIALDGLQCFAIMALVYLLRPKTGAAPALHTWAALVAMFSWVLLVVGATGWLLFLRSSVTMLGLMLGFTLFVFLFLVALAPDPPTAVLVFVSLIAATGGTALGYSAYRAWMAADLA